MRMLQGIRASKGGNERMLQNVVIEELIQGASLSVGM